MKITRRKHSLYRFILQQLPDHWTTGGDFSADFHHKEKFWRWDVRGKRILGLSALNNDEVYVYDEEELPLIKKLVEKYEDYINREGVPVQYKKGDEIKFAESFQVTIVLAKPEEI